MIDTLDLYRARAAQLDMPDSLGLEPGKYVLVTLHRPTNADEPDRLASILGALGEIASHYPVVFPVHPRTARSVKQFGLEGHLGSLRALGAIRYLEFLCLMDQAGLVISDSGGIQEETTVLGIPCITVRPNTERPITITEGSNRLFDGDPAEMPGLALKAITEGRRPHRPALWDGHAAERIAEVTLNQLANRRSATMRPKA
jgi:UDP-N-acetylglucosamine 2-epimerase (non-hydrolysing)